MKKLILLLVSGMLILSLAGSAMAANAVLLDEDGNDCGSTCDMIPGSSMVFGVLFENIADSQRNLPYDYKVEVHSPDSDGYYTVVPDASEISATLLKLQVTIPTETFTDTGVLKVELGDNVPVGNTYEVTLITGKDGIPFTQIVAASQVVATVPEFPIIAAPMAAILGLVFIFGRKKEGL